MSDTFNLTVGNKGRVVLPAALRENKNWGEGTTLVALETERGVVLTTRSELQAVVRAQLAGKDIVGDLLRGRRAEASRDDVA